jgi:hypothetical protein
MEGPCHFCKRKAPKIAGKEDGAPGDVFLCAGCTVILRGPRGVEFMRNHHNLELRDEISREALDSMNEKFTELALEMRSRKDAN